MENFCGGWVQESFFIRNVLKDLVGADRQDSIAKKELTQIVQLDELTELTSELGEPHQLLCI
jgi:hypothetical protein